MTPARVRELLVEVEARQERLEAEAAAAAEIAEGLRRLLAVIEQPGQGERDIRPQPSEARAEPTPATTPVPASPVVDCPECGREVKRQGLGIHLSKAHGIAGGAVKTKRREPALAGGRGKAPPVLPGSPSEAPQPVTRNGRESFLCSRCPESFATRELQLAHMAKGHAADPGNGLKPIGRDPLANRGGAGTAVKLA